MNAIPEKICFAEGFSASVKPGIDAPLMRPVRRKRIGHHQSVRLNAAVDFLDVAANHKASRAGPWGFTTFEAAHPLIPDAEQFLPSEDVFSREKLVAFKS